MIGQQQDDFEKQDVAKQVGVVMAEDDLEVGQHVCVYALKRHPDEGAPILGQSLQVKAICLPYFVGQLISDPGEPIITLDCRFLKLMKVSQEFVDAQREGVSKSIEMMRPHRRKPKEEKQP